MHVVWTLGWVVASIFSAAVSAIEPQRPLGPYGTSILSAEDTIVPLHPRAGKGLLPPHLEKGAILSLGPTFMNVIYENSTDYDVGTCWKCIPTIGKETPCIYEAIKQKSVAPLIQCGVTKADLCNCAACLPDILQSFVEHYCHDKEDEPDKPTRKNPPAPAERVAEADINFSAFKGSLLKSTVRDLKAVNWCPGSSCGGCNCCLGACLFGACAGACV